MTASSSTPTLIAWFLEQNLRWRTLIYTFEYAGVRYIQSKFYNIVCMATWLIHNNSQWRLIKMMGWCWIRSEPCGNNLTKCGYSTFGLKVWRHPVALLLLFNLSSTVQGWLTCIIVHWVQCCSFITIVQTCLNHCEDTHQIKRGYSTMQEGKKD